MFIRDIVFRTGGNRAHLEPLTLPPLQVAIINTFTIITGTRTGNKNQSLPSWQRWPRRAGL
jgi:hypothetical protein